MQYISPFSLLPNTPDKTFTRKDLVLAKRKLLAEFELQGSSTILHNNKEMSRNDVLVFFDELDKKDDLGFHLIVSNDPVLLSFLENHAIQPNAKFITYKYNQTDDFIEWLSPYFRDAFKDASLRYFKKQEIYEFKTLMNNPLLLANEHASAAWQPVENYLDNLLQQLEWLNSDKDIVIHEAEITMLIKFDQVNMIKLLPQERFQLQINNYAFEMMRSSIEIFNKLNREWALVILEDAKSLHVSEETYQSLLDKENEMKGIISSESNPPTSRSKSSSSSSDSGNTWAIIRAVAFLLIALARIATCSNSTKSYDDYPKISYFPKVYNQERELEPIEHRLSAEDMAMVANHHFAQDTLLKEFLETLKRDRVNKEKDYTYAKVANGEDAYKKIWLAPAFTKYFRSTIAVIEKLETDAALSDFQLLKKVKHAVAVNNNSGYDMVVFVCRKDSVFSRFIHARKAIDITLLEGSDKVYLYPGNRFSYDSSFMFYPEGQEKGITVKGAFTQNVTLNKHLLYHPIYFSCSRPAEKEEKARIQIDDNDDASGIKVKINDTKYVTHLSRFDAGLNKKRIKINLDNN